MISDDFSEGYRQLCAAFQKTMNAAAGVEYFKTFRDLSGDKWIALVDYIKRNEEKFPTIRRCGDLAQELRLMARDERREAQRQDPWVVVLCNCGSSFACSKGNVSNGQSQKCPMCERVYDAVFIQEMAEHDVVDVEGRLRPAKQINMFQEGHA